jgi:hypothetical protein
MKKPHRVKVILRTKESATMGGVMADVILQDDDYQKVATFNTVVDVDQMRLAVQRWDNAMKRFGDKGQEIIDQSIAKAKELNE